MKFNRLAAALAFGAAISGPAVQAASPDAWREYVSAQYAKADQAGAGAIAGVSGWYFLTAELHFLSASQFWGEKAAAVSRATKPEAADPLPAIIDFQQQLKARGIELLLVPVPPKAALESAKLAPEGGYSCGDTMEPLARFYKLLEGSGVHVLDLSTTFSQNEKETPMYCRTDTHWSGVGCELAASAITAQLGLTPKGNAFEAEQKEVEIQGDMASLLPVGMAKPEPEKVRIMAVKAAGTGAAVEPDAHSPVLLIGDSHTLVYHDFLAEHAGLVDQLALKLGFAPDLIGTRGSGATAVRISLYRRSVKDPAYLRGKKVVVWCFTAREFTESADGWPKLPVSK
jgi:alginate O-acetyltransferase complex protein AlgJ